MAYEDVIDEVTARLTAERSVARLSVEAEATKAALKAGTSLEDQGLAPRVETDQTRNAFLVNRPRGFTAEVFEMELGDIRILEGTDTVVLVRLDAVHAAGDSAEASALVAQLREQQNQALARGLFDIFADDTLLRAGQNIDPRAVNAVNVNFQ